MTYVALCRAGWYAGTTDIRELLTGGIAVPGLDGSLAPGWAGWSAGTTDIRVLLTGGVALSSPHGLRTLVGTLHWLGQSIGISLSRSRGPRAPGAREHEGARVRRRGWGVRARCVLYQKLFFSDVGGS